MKFNRKVFFTLFPIGYWIVVIVGIVLHFLPEVSQLGNVLIDFGSFLLAFKSAIIVHEAGHLLAAKTVGGIPRRIVLGKGHELYRTEMFGISFVINSSFLGGYAYASFDQQKFLKLRYAFFILGGMLLNAVFALIFYVFFELELTDSKGEVLISVPFTIFLANSLMLLNFIPYYTSILGMKVPTDGLALLKLPFTHVKEVKKRLDANVLFDGYTYLEKKDYRSAWNIFNDHVTKYPDSNLLSINLSFILLKTGQTEKSIEECLKLLGGIHDEPIKPYSALIYNQLAWTYLVLGNIERADHFSALAIKAIPTENQIRGTRGSVLIEKGLTTEGMTLLFHNMDFQFVNNATLSAAIYLMLAYHVKRNLKESDKYLQFVKKNEVKLELDEKILFERNLSKMHSQKEFVN